MQFVRNHDEDRAVWVDRGIDGRVDGFQVCDPCNNRLIIQDAIREEWREMNNLCLDCRMDFASHSLASDISGIPRPINGMMQDSFKANMEMEAEPLIRSNIRLDYFDQDYRY